MNLRSCPSRCVPVSSRWPALCSVLVSVLATGAAPAPETWREHVTAEQPPWDWQKLPPSRKQAFPHLNAPDEVESRFAPGEPTLRPARARAVYQPLYLRKLTRSDQSVQSVLDAITQGSAWNRRELAAPAFDAATGLVLVGTSDRHFYAVSSRSGETLWSHATEGRVSSTPILDGELVLFGADDGGIYGLRKGTGAEVFHYQADSEVTAPLRVLGQRVFAHTASDTVVCLERETGKWLWQARHPLPAGISLLGESAPAVGVVLRPGDVALDTVFVGYADGSVAALDAADGRELWSTPVGRGDDFVDVDADLQYDAGVLYAAAFHGGVRALDPLSGATLWTAPVEGVNRMTLTASALVLAGPRQVVALSRQDGRVRWRFTFPSGGAATPVVHRGRVLVASDRGTLFVLSFVDGRPLQYYGGHPGFSSRPAVYEDTLFLLSNGGSLHALSDHFGGILAARRERP